MALIEEGRICILRTGRNSGQKVVVLQADGKGNATIEGIVVKKKKCNARHLFPTASKINVKGASKEELTKALKEGI